MLNLAWEDGWYMRILSMLHGIGLRKICMGRKEFVKCIKLQVGSGESKILT